jgi:hypothetical protein
MGEEIIVEEFVDKGNQKPDKEMSDKEILNNLLQFLGKSSLAVGEYIEDNNIPTAYITPNKRIDLHPAYEYMLRVPRVVGDILRQKKMIDGQEDPLSEFWRQ